MNAVPHEQEVPKPNGFESRRQESHVAFTIFSSYAAASKQELNETLRELSDRIRSATAPAKEELPWIKLARFGQQRTEKNSLRHDANVLEITGVEADYDGESISFDQALDTLGFAGLTAILYTSPSHTESKPRWRVLCPTSRPLPPPQRGKMLGRLNGLFQGQFSGESWTLSQSYYLGSVNRNPAHQVELLDGFAIDQLDELDAGAIGKPQTKPGPNGSTAPGGRLDEAAALAEIISGTSYHSACVRLLGKWALEGVPLIESKARLQTAFEQVPEAERDERWRRRFADIDRCVLDIFVKEAKKADSADGETKEGKPKRARPTREQRTPTGLPLIVITAGELHTITTSAEDAIIKAAVPIFQRGSGLVRPVTRETPASNGRTTLASGLYDLTAPALVDVLSAVAEWERYDARAEAMVRTNPPRQAADILLARFGQWRVPPIAGVITTPTMRPDGSILSASGYDSVTRLYHVADPTLNLHPQVEQPMRDLAERAVRVLEELLVEFPFVSGTSKAVALSALLTPVVRGAVPVAPMHLFRAPTPGSGKSYLADVSSAITSGRPCPVITAAANEEETEKRLVGLLLAGFPIISLDNVNGELGGDLLCQAIERPLIRVRPLGRSDIVEIESKCTVLGTGNNARVRGDMVRRTLVADLDPDMERPEERQFKGDPVATVLADRGRYVSACLVIVRAYKLAGSPNKLPPIASFSAWSDMVRSALVWLGCADPAESMRVAREDDPELGDMRELMAAWHDAFGSLPQTIRRAVEVAITPTPQPDENGDVPERGATMALPYPQLQEAFIRLAGMRGGVIDGKKLGYWLLAHQGRVVSIDGLPEGLRFERDGVTHGAARWKLSRSRSSGGGTGG